MGYKFSPKCLTINSISVKKQLDLLIGKNVVINCGPFMLEGVLGKRNDNKYFVNIVTTIRFNLLDVNKTTFPKVVGNNIWLS